MEKTYRFLPYFFATFLIVVIYCFYQSYFSHIPDFQNVISPIGNVPITITTITHFHAIIVVLWLLMLIIQPILIINKRNYKDIVASFWNADNADVPTQICTDNLRKSALNLFISVICTVRRCGPIFCLRQYLYNSEF